jgi:RNA polymerase-binding transcription factor DksA
MNRVTVSPQLRTALLNKAAECQKQLSGAGCNLRAEPMLEVMDEAAPASQREPAAERIEYSSRTLRQVEAALSRMERGSYGACLRCKEAIAQERLSTLPWAPFCPECQEGADLLHELVEARRKYMRHAA